MPCLVLVSHRLAFGICYFLRAWLVTGQVQHLVQKARKRNKRNFQNLTKQTCTRWFFCSAGCWLGLYWLLLVWVGTVVLLVSWISLLVVRYFYLLGSCFGIFRASCLILHVFVLLALLAELKSRVSHHPINSFARTRRSLE